MFRHLVFSLFILILFSACEQNFEFEMQPPGTGGFAYQTVEVEGHRLALVVKFPEGFETYTKSTRLLIQARQDKGEQSFSVKLADDSPFVVNAVRLTEGQVLYVILARAKNSSDARYDNLANHGTITYADLPFGLLVKSSEKWWDLSQNRCTAFMVGRNLAVTNNHCIANQNECNRSSVLVWNSKESYIKRNFFTSSYSCGKVLFTDPLYDQTLFQIDGDASKYGTYSVADPGLYVPKGTQVQVTSMSPDPSGATNKTYRLCEVNTSLLKINKGTRLAQLMNCSSPVVHGNSGSPVFNKNGSVIGVVWGVEEGVNPPRGIFNPLHPAILQRLHKLKI